MPCDAELLAIKRDRPQDQPARAARGERPYHEQARPPPRAQIAAGHRQSYRESSPQPTGAAWTSGSGDRRCPARSAEGLGSATALCIEPHVDCSKHERRRARQRPGWRRPLPPPLLTHPAVLPPLTPAHPPLRCSVHTAMEDVGASLLGTLLLMFAGALLCGAAPFFLRIRELHLQTLAALGAGLLIGSALAVIVPEGFHAFAEVRGGIACQAAGRRREAASWRTICSNAAHVHRPRHRRLPILPALLAGRPLQASHHSHNHVEVKPEHDHEHDHDHSTAHDHSASLPEGIAGLVLVGGFLAMLLLDHLQHAAGGRCGAPGHSHHGHSHSHGHAHSHGLGSGGASSERLREKGEGAAAKAKTQGAAPEAAAAAAGEPGAAPAGLASPAKARPALEADVSGKAKGA